MDLIPKGGPSGWLALKSDRLIVMVSHGWPISTILQAKIVMFNKSI